jgi:hypothetical protein
MCVALWQQAPARKRQGKAKNRAQPRQGPASLATREMLCGTPKLKIAVIDPDLKRIVKSSQELTPILESLSDCEHLTIPDLIIALGFFKQCGLEGN